MNHCQRLCASVLSFALFTTPVSAAPGPGPGEPFGGDDAGCVPTTSTRLSCAIAVGKAFDKLEASVVKCHSDEAKSRYDEFVLGSSRPFDEEGCEATAVARFDDTVLRLATGTCLTSPSMTTIDADRDALLAALDAENAGPWCDDTTGEPIFANGLMPPASWTSTLVPQDVTLHASSNAIDAGRMLAGVNDGFTGAAPDLGALEVGCPLPIYGIRPEGIDESNQPFGCAP